MAQQWVRWIAGNYVNVEKKEGAWLSSQLREILVQCDIIQLFLPLCFSPRLSFNSLDRKRRTIYFEWKQP